MSQAQLGDFVFSVRSAEFTDLSRAETFRWARRERLDAIPVRQFLGADAREITLRGYILPENAADIRRLDALKIEARAGEKLPLFLNGDATQSGTAEGYWVIDSLSVDESIPNRDGSPRRLDFQLRLSQYSE